MQQLLSRYSGNVLSCTLGPLQSLQTTESVSESRDSWVESDTPARSQPSCQVISCFTNNFTDYFSGSVEQYFQCVCFCSDNNVRTKQLYSVYLRGSQPVVNEWVPSQTIKVGLVEQPLNWLVFATVLSCTTACCLVMKLWLPCLMVTSKPLILLLVL